MSLLPTLTEDDFQDDFQVIPAGNYDCMIVSSCMKPTKTGGEFLLLEIDVIEGKYQGRKVFTRLNLVNSNPKAVSIARKELAQICTACNVNSPKDSQDLHNIPFFATIGIDPANNGFKESNKITKFSKKNPW